MFLDRSILSLTWFLREQRQVKLLTRDKSNILHWVA